MSITLTLLLVAATAGATTWMGFRCTRESRKLLKEKREAEAKKATEEMVRLAREESDSLMLQSVAKALKVLFSEARDYNHREEENRRHGYRVTETKFPREIREGFHKVLRVSALEADMGALSSRVDTIAKHRKEIFEQVGEIHKVLKDYA